MKVSKILPSDLKEAVLNNDVASFARFRLLRKHVFGKKGKSMLHYISKYSDDFTLGILCINSFKLKPNTLTRKGKLSALHIACKYGRLNTVNALLAFPETNKNLQDSFGETGLSLASKHNHTEIAIVLLQFNVSVNTKNKKLWSPLHWASWNGNSLLVTGLIELGANPEQMNENEENCLHLAAENGCLETVKLLCKYVSALKISAKGTLLHHGKEHPEVLDYILVNTPWIMFEKLPILLEINAPTHVIIKNCYKELASQSMDLVLLYDRADLIQESYNKGIIGEDDIKGLMQRVIKGKCELVIKQLNRWQTVKKLLFVYKFSWKTNNFVNLSLGILREISLYI